MRVMLVDDSATMRKIQKRVVTSFGIEDIVEAGSGLQALEQLEANNFDFTFILCDMNMPEMNGIDAIKQIRANPASKDIPVIMCTSVAEKHKVVEAIKAGASNYVIKPFRQEELKEKLKPYLPAEAQ